MSERTNPALSDSHLESAFLTLAGLVLTDHEADERGYLHYDTEYEGVIRDRASVAHRLLRELGLDRPASPYKPREDEGAFEWLANENQRLREAIRGVGSAWRGGEDAEVATAIQAATDAAGLSEQGGG